MTIPAVIQGLNKRLHDLVRFAIANGWSATRTRGGHLCLMKPGCAPIYTSSTPSDHRFDLNARARIRRAATHTISGENP